jgi:hypothetical protein
MVDSREYLTNSPHFDFNTAIEDFGFDFEPFKENNFHDFVESLIQDYTNLRKNYILRNYRQFRSEIHKLKGMFL